MTHGSYVPLAADGLRAERVFAFQRTHHEDALVVAVPRLTCGFGGDLPIREAWGDTRIRLAEGTFATTWRCEVGGQVVQSVDGWLSLADLTSRLPVAVLAPQR